MREITITPAQDGQRFDRFLNRYLPGASSGFIHKMLRKKNIKLNQAKAEGNEKLKAGDKIQIYFSEETFEKFSPATDSNREYGKKDSEDRALRRAVKLIYRNDHIAVFHKPAGMLTQKSKREDDSLNDYLLDYVRKNKLISEEALLSFRPAAANRLDRNTSGMVLCGLSIHGLQLLSHMLKERELKKYYYCIVKGAMKEKGGKIRGYLTKDEKTNVVTISKEKSGDSSYIATDYQVLVTNERASLLRIRLITGKSHQIRAHLASIGHPVAGDYKYGDRRFNDQLKRDCGLTYQMLHSGELVFPDTMELNEAGIAGLRLKDPMPQEFLKVREYFHLWERGIQED